MIKTNPKSWFAIKSLDQISNFGGVILQAEKTDTVFSDSKQPVYLCELVSRADHHSRTIEDMADEILKQNAEIRRLRNKVDRLQRELSQVGEKRQSDGRELQVL